MSGGEGEGEGKLPSVDHGRRTDKGRDKNIRSSGLAVLCCQLRAGFSSKLGDYPKAFGLITLLMNIFCKDLYVPICP